MDTMRIERTMRLIEYENDKPPKRQEKKPGVATPGTNKRGPALKGRQSVDGGWY